MGKGTDNSKFSLIEQFIMSIIETDGGFAEIPFDWLVEFSDEIKKEYGFLPLSEDDRWDEIMNRAAEKFIDNSEDE